MSHKIPSIFLYFEPDSKRKALPSFSPIGFCSARVGQAHPSCARIDEKISLKIPEIKVEMRKAMEQLQKDIASGQFKKCYLLYGEETYLKRQYKQRLRDALIPQGDTMNLSSYQGKGIDVKPLIDFAETLPFFADYRLILIEDSGFFKNAEPLLADYLPTAPSSTVFLFVESEVDKRNRLYKTVKDLGRVVEMKPQTEATLERWVLGTLKKEGKQITKPTLELFFSKTGLDMEIISQELEKLLSYCLEKDTITPEDVNAVCISQTPDQIFQMINAIANKQTKQAIALYYDLLLLREAPLRILALLVRQFRILLRIKDLQQLGYSNNTIFQKAGMPAFAARQCLQQTQKFTMEDLKAALEACAQTEEDIKTGKIAGQLGVELLIVTYSS